MIGFPEVLLDIAKNSGMRVPESAEEYDKSLYPHWHVYLSLQCGASMPPPDSPFRNASLIAKLSADEIKRITYDQLIDRGLEIGRSTP